MTKVTILITTYNHEHYIAKAIDSVINQETTKPYEILIGDDCSTDNTAAVLKQLKELYPDKINLVLRENNVGPIENFLDLLQKAKGEYISLLEGDDYWESRDKIEKIISFLDENSEYVGAFHNIHVVDAKNSYNIEHEYHEFDRFSDVNSQMEHFSGKMMMTLSLVFRNIFLTRENLDRLRKILGEVKYVGDYSLKAYLLAHGKFKYFSQIWGAYRHITTHGSSWSAQSQNVKDDDFLIVYRNNIIEYGSVAEKHLDSPYTRLFFMSLIVSLKTRNFKRLFRLFVNFDYSVLVRRNIYIRIFCKIFLVRKTY